MRSSALFVALCFFFLYTQLAVADFSQGFSAYEASSFQVALAEFRKSSRQGDARAQYMLGRMYQHGYGVVVNNGVAIDYYRMAAEQGHAKAQYTLGVIHQKGLDLPILQDTVDESIETGLGPVGAMQGMRTAATHRLGLSYSEAEKWYSLAANQGLVEAPIQPRPDVCLGRWYSSKLSSCLFLVGCSRGFWKQARCRKIRYTQTSHDPKRPRGGHASYQ